MLKQIAFWIICLVCTMQRLAAQDCRFTASASATSMSVGDQVEISFELQGNGRGFQAPSFPDLNILMGPSQSSSMQIINGSVSQSISYTYVLQAVREGTFRIGPASIECNGKRVQSNGLTITVSKGAAKPQQGNAQQRGNAPDAYSLAKNVFLKAHVDHSGVYRGEALVVTYKLYTRVAMVSYALNKIPALEGFYSQEIEMPQQPQFYAETLDGVQYKVADIKKVVLFPQRSGKLSVDPMKGEIVARVQAKQQQRSRDPFDFFFNDPFFQQYQDVPVPLASEPVKIIVKDLPPGAPAGYNGAVGKFSIQSSVDKKEARAHDAINLKIKISGQGNIKLLDAPGIDFPPDFERYDPRVNSSASATTAGVSGSKTFEYLMIPKNPGEYKLKIGTFSWFNPGKNKYETVEGPEFVLKIAKGEEGVATTAVSGVSKSDVQYLGKDIRFIKTAVPLIIQTGNSYYNSVVFYLLCVLPLILFVLLIMMRKRYAESQKNQGLLRSRRATKAARKRLALAKKLMAEGKSSAFLDEMFRALWGYVSDKLQIPVADLSKENVSTALAGRHVSGNTIFLFVDAINACEFARFGGNNAGSAQEIYQKGIDVISKMEGEIA